MFKEINEFYNCPNFTLALFIGRQNNGGNHIGILVMNNEASHIYHLLWHKNFKKNDIASAENGRYYKVAKWVDFEALNNDNDFRKTRSKAIIALLEIIYENKRDQIAYGINFKQTLFAQSNADIQYGNNEHGLTCATFILSLLNSVNINLIDINTWQKPRLSDRCFKNQIVKDLCNDFPEDKQAKLVLKEPYNYRIRPEEVFAASSLYPIPATFENCSNIGKKFNKIPSLYHRNYKDSIKDLIFSSNICINT